MSLFARKPIAELLAEEGSPNSLRRALGTGDLIMLAIGAVIGAGIFSFGIWLVIGMLLYFFYGFRHSTLRIARDGTSPTGKA